MGFLDVLFAGRGHGIDELARRLGMDITTLQAVPVRYQVFTVPKRSGGMRTINAPEKELKKLQRNLLRRVFARWRTHDAVHGFARGRCILTNAQPHAGKAVVVRMDIRDFFPATTAARVTEFFRQRGWNKPAAALLTRLCTHEGGLPQGAPTSPQLANLVNYGLDVALAKLAQQHAATYTRYADDLTFSFARDDRNAIHALVRQAKFLCLGAGYTLHQKKKLRIRRQHQRQEVTGLVVNVRPQLPRATRRRLRAVAHRARTGKMPTLRREQRAGWDALLGMLGSPLRLS